jgi:predicted glycosyltransferase
MNILIQLSHPAHFHLYKNAIRNYQEDGHMVFVLIKTKDILENLLQNAGIEYFNILPVAHRGSKLGILWDMIVRDWRIMRFCRKHAIDILSGSTPEVAQVAWLLGLKSINTTEDDATVIGAVIKAMQPFVKCILAPIPCKMEGIEKHTVHYPSYHELAYLHPNHFTADKSIVDSYGIDSNKPYFILRFASLNAHHDDGIKGINTQVAQRLIDILSPHGQIYITSERELEPQFEPYRIRINPLDMHHVMAFASLYIGDSQTMAAEAGVLGTPFVRFNDFVGRIGYLRELEDVYQLGYGIHASVLTEDSPIRRNDGTLQPSGVEALYQAVENLVAMPAEERRQVFAVRREKMLSEKIDYAKFLTWFIEEYPQSARQTRENQENMAFWAQFK